MATWRWLVRYWILLICISAFRYASAVEERLRASTGMRNRVKRTTSGNRLTYEERIDFLRLHNEYRSETNPLATDMQFILWHTELADMAQEWADACDFNHGQPDGFSPPFDPIGQNLYASTAPAVNGLNATESWYSENTDYVYDLNRCAEGKVCGHYTQLVWANSANLGCAIAKCAHLDTANMNDATFIVCNYGPAGNIANQWPFTRGPTCSSCPSGTKCEDYLCINDPKCGEKTCANGEMLDEYCECHYIETTTTADHNQNEAVTEPVCGDKICENGEVLDENCECRCPDGETCAGDYDNRNGTGETKVCMIWLYTAIYVFVSFF